MTTQVIDERAEWLKSRKTALGASDVPAILGVSPWGSSWEVWADKTERLEDWKGSAATRAGLVFERPVLDTAEAELGPLERNVRVVHSQLPVASTLDGLVVASGEPVEAKTTGIVGPVFGDWGEALTDQVPDYYLVQVHTQLLVTGAELGYLFALIAGRGVVKYQIARSETVCERLGTLCEEWWQRHVINDIEPSRETPPALEVVKRFRRKAKKKVVFDLGQSALVEMRSELKDQVKTLEAKLDICESQILLALGDAEAADLSDGSELTYFETTRSGYVVNECKFRTIRVKSPKTKKVKSK